MNTGRGFRFGYIRATLFLCFVFQVASAHAQWSINGSNIYFNGGNVGIGTTGPNFKLDVQGGSINSSSALYNGGYATLANDGTNSTLYSAANSFQVVNSTGSVALLKVLNTGDVGIGTAAPAQLLDIGKATTDGTTKSALIRTTARTSGGGIRSWDFGATSDTLGFYIKDTVMPTASLSISYGIGDVGIGTTNPSTGRLQVSRDVPGLVGYGYSQLSLEGTTDSSKQVLIGFDTTSNYAFIQPLHSLVSWSDYNLALAPAGGNVGIGTSSPSERLQVEGNVVVNGNISAKYQDLAEWVPSNKVIQSGYVVIVDQTLPGNVLPSSEAYDTRVAGVVSESPGIVLGESGSGKVKVATVGRVKVKVDATHNPIQIGDLLVTSGNAGMAMKSEPVDVSGIKMHRPGTLLGKALEPLGSGMGEITVLLSLQ